MMQPDLTDAVVELTAPDGRVFRFRYGATIPYAGTDYVVLLEMESAGSEDEQILITRLSESPEGLAFEVAEEEDVVEAVYTKYCALRLQESIADLPECEDGCDCGHHHHHDGGCGCCHE